MDQVNSELIELAAAAREQAAQDLLDELDEQQYGEMLAIASAYSYDHGKVPC